MLISGVAAFDMDYARWVEESNRQLSELRSALAAHVTDNDLRLLVDNSVAHYDELFRLKGVAVKADVFHIVSGMWKTPAERCFMWMGGFRPSELLKVYLLLFSPAPLFYDNILCLSIFFCDIAYKSTQVLCTS